jgi:dTDP-4-dehydrorhamnose 3,5-epimerase
VTVAETDLPGVLLIETRTFPDERGYFVESWNERRYRELGIDRPFVQDNLSRSRKGVLRGLHFQEPSPQGKLLSVLQGEVWDVALDIRVGSETFGRWTAVTLSEANGRQLFIPEGFAHGFVALSEGTLVSYKCTDYYDPACEEIIRWDDPDLAIEWPVRDPLVAMKDRNGARLRDMPSARLPRLPG